MAALKNSNPSMGDYKDVLIVIEESRSWLSVSEISSISAVSQQSARFFSLSLLRAEKYLAKARVQN